MSEAVFVYRCKYCGDFFDGDPGEEDRMTDRYRRYIDGNITRDIPWSRAFHECYVHIRGVGELVAIKLIKNDIKLTEEKANNVDN